LGLKTGLVEVKPLTNRFDVDLTGNVSHIACGISLAADDFKSLFKASHDLIESMR
jgi:hypothetical protein